LKIFLTDVEGLRHGGNELRFLGTDLVVALNKFQQVDEHHEFLMLVQFFVHLGTDLQHLNGVEGSAFATATALATTGMKGLHKCLIAGHMGGCHLVAELLAQETLQDGSIIRTCAFGHGVPFRNDGEQLQ